MIVVSCGGVPVSRDSLASVIRSRDGKSVASRLRYVNTIPKNFWSRQKLGNCHAQSVRNQAQRRKPNIVPTAQQSAELRSSLTDGLSQTGDGVACGGHVMPDGVCVCHAYIMRYAATSGNSLPSDSGGSFNRQYGLQLYGSQ